MTWRKQEVSLALSDGRKGKGPIPGLPYRNSTTIYPDEVQERIDRAMARIDAAIKRVEDETAGLSQKKRETIVGALRAAKQEIELNVPFVVKSFDEHMHDTIERAKVEVNAYVQNVIQRAGIERLNAGAHDAPIALGSGGEP